MFPKGCEVQWLYSYKLYRQIPSFHLHHILATKLPLNVSWFDLRWTMSTRSPHTRPTQQGKRMKTTGKSIQLLLEGINDEYGVIQQRLCLKLSGTAGRLPSILLAGEEYCEGKLFSPRTQHIDQARVTMFFISLLTNLISGLYAKVTLK